MTVRDLTIRHGFIASEFECLAREFPGRLRICTNPSGPQGGRPSKTVELPPFPSTGITH